MLLLGAALIGVPLALYSLGMRNWQPDEELFLHLGSFIDRHLPGSLFGYAEYQRGPQRLTLFLLALTQGIWAAPLALQVAKILQVAIFVSTCVPVYLWARALGMRRGVAVVPSLFSILVPWTTVTLSFLTENISYPLSVWALFACWRAAVLPSWRRDVIAALALASAVLAKTSLAALLPVLPVVVLAGAITDIRAGRSVGRRAVARAVRTHALLALSSVAVAIGILAFVLGGQRLGSGLFGVYGTPSGVTLHSVAHQSQILLSRLVAGTGIVAACIAFPWAVRRAFMAESTSDRSLAVLCLAATVLLVVSTALIWGDDRPGIDERYAMYLSPLVYLVAARAVSKREIRPVEAALGGAAITWLIVGTGWGANQATGFKYLAYPAETFLTRVVFGNIAVHAPHFFVGHVQWIVSLLGALSALGLAIVLRRGSSRGVNTTLVLTTLAIGGYAVAQLSYVLDKGTLLAGARDSPVGWTQRTWVDQLVGRRANVAVIGLGFGNSQLFQPLWREVQFWNSRVRTVVKFGPGGTPETPGDEVIWATVNHADGSVRTGGRLPEYALVARNPLVADLPVKRLARSSYLDIDLARTPDRLRLAWELRSGVYDDGFVLPGQRAQLRVFSWVFPVHARACVRFTLLAPPGFPHTWSVKVQGGDRPFDGRLRQQQRITLTLPLVRSSAGHFRDVYIASGKSVLYPDRRRVGLRVLDVRPYVCRRTPRARSRPAGRPAISTAMRGLSPAGVMPGPTRISGGQG